MSKFNELFNTIMEDCNCTSKCKDCKRKNLTTLSGSPKEVGKDFSDNAKIKDLSGTPKTIHQSQDDYDDEDEDYEAPTITVGDLRKELSDCDPDEEIGMSWNCYSDGGDMCGGCYYDKWSKAFYFVQYTPGEDGYEYDEEDLDDDGDWKNGPPVPAPTVQEVLDEIKNLPDDMKVFGSWEANDNARYCIESINGSHLELDGGTEC